jgi:hypothetical protein
MRRPISFGVLLILSAGVLGATVFREQVAYAADKAVATRSFPLRLDSAVAGERSETFGPAGPIDASLITLTSMSGDGVVSLRNGDDIVLIYRIAEGLGTIVLPLIPPLTVDRLVLVCIVPPCSAEFNIVGR